MQCRFTNHMGLFVDNNGYPNSVRHRALRAVRHHGPDIFGRPQFAIDGLYIASWEGHSIWDRFSVLTFDVYGFVQPSDGGLDLGCTYDGEPLEFTRTPLELRDFDFEPHHCIEVYLKHLESKGQLELIAPSDALVQEALSAAEAEYPGSGKDDLAVTFERLGVLSRVG